MMIGGFGFMRDQHGELLGVGEWRNGDLYYGQGVLYKTREDGVKYISYSGILISGKKHLYGTLFYPNGKK